MKDKVVVSDVKPNKEDPICIFCASHITGGIIANSKVVCIPCLENVTIVSKQIGSFLPKPWSYGFGRHRPWSLVKGFSSTGNFGGTEGEENGA